MSTEELLGDGQVDMGPPPSMEKRQLIFDSLAKIIGKNFQKDPKSTFARPLATAPSLRAVAVARC
mgnify:CR=1 FL=1